MTKWFCFNVALGSLVIASAIVACGGHSRASSTTGSGQYSASVANMQALVAGISLYENDSDGFYPLANKWVDETSIYVSDQNVFRSPAVASRGYGYAMNSVVAGQAQPSIPNPDQTINFFDSTDLSKNATDGVQTLPAPPRYGAYNTVSYADGRIANSLQQESSTQLYSTSMARVKSVGLGLLEYANDYDDELPQTGTWMDVTTPYVKDPELFQSPLIELNNPALYGYACNVKIAGVNESTISSSFTTIGIFDSTDLLRNATDPDTTLPIPGRYAGENTIGYVDGHVMNPGASARTRQKQNTKVKP